MSIARRALFVSFGLTMRFAPPLQGAGAEQPRTPHALMRHASSKPAQRPNQITYPRAYEGQATSQTRDCKKADPSLLTADTV
jgi:hypothetical protein